MVVIRPLLARWFVSLASMLLALAITSALFAQEPSERKERQEAIARFQRGIELENAQNWAGALALFREAGSFKMTPQVRFHIGLCEENLGQLVAALGGYQLALADADNVGPSFKAEVEERAERLRARIPKLVIERGEGARAAKIQLNGQPLGEASIGVPNSVDPGPHVIEARAPGHKPFNETVTIAEEEEKTVTVLLETLPEDEAVPVTPSGGPSAGVEFDSERPSIVSEMLPFIVGGIGVVSLVGSGAFFLLRQDAISDIEKICGGSDCSKTTIPDADKERARDRKQEMENYHTLMIVTGIVGLAGVGGGVALYFLNRPSKTEARALAWPRSAGVRLVPGAPSTDAGLSLVGVF